MAGPIRDFLQRQPIRNAIRSMVGAEPRYGLMGDRLAAVADSDRRGLTDLLSGPRRLGRRRDITPMTPVSSAPVQTVAPSPEARAVAMSREDDASRRTQSQRQSEGLTSPPPAAAAPMAPQQAAAPPVDPRQAQAAGFYSRAEKVRAEAAALAQHPSFSSEGSGLLRSRYDTLMMQADGIEARGLALESEARQEVLARDAMKQSSTDAAARLAAQHPEDSLRADAQKFAETVRQQGMGAGAMLATDTYFAKTNPTLPSTDAAYVARLNQYRVAAAGITLADRFSERRPMVGGDPTLAEMAALVAEMQPRDPQARAAVVRSIVASAQQQAKMPPQTAAAMAQVLTQMIERQITGK